MKNISKFLLCVLILNVSFFSVYAADEPQYYCNTDIVAYINELPIKSYNIDGYTGIVAEDLAKYKFRVNYYDEYRLLTIEYVDGDLSKISADYTPQPLKYPIGSIAGRIYKTDIKVRLGKNYVKGYNIGGQTIILIDELNIYGDVIWNPNERKICYTYQKSWEHNIETDKEIEHNMQIDGFSFDLSLNNNVYVVNGQNLNYLENLKIGNSKQDGFCLKFSLYQRVMPVTENLQSLLDSCVNTDYEGNYIQDSTEKAKEHIRIYVNNQPIRIKKITQGKGNGHIDYYIYLDCNIKENEFKNMSVSVK